MASSYVFKKITLVITRNSAPSSNDMMMISALSPSLKIDIICTIQTPKFKGDVFTYGGFQKVIPVPGRGKVIATLLWAVFWRFVA